MKMPKRVDMREQDLLGAQGTRRSLNVIMYLSLKSIILFLRFFFFFPTNSTKVTQARDMIMFPRMGSVPRQPDTGALFFFKV